MEKEVVWKTQYFAQLTFSCTNIVQDLKNFFYIYKNIIIIYLILYKIINEYYINNYINGDKTSVVIVVFI